MSRKSTSLFSVFVLFFALAVKAQPGSSAIFPYYQNFDTLIAGQTIEEQGGWYVDLIPLGIINAIEISSNRGLNGSQSMSINLNDNIPTDSTSSPLIGPMTANTTIGYSYRIVNSSGLAHTLTGNAGFKILFKQNISTQWNLVDSISVTNHIDSADYSRIEIPIGTFNGMIGNFRIAFYQGFPGDDFFIDIDSLVVYDPTITNLSLNTENSNDYIITSNDVNQITISNKGIITPNNSINIFSVDGKLIYSSNIKNSNTMIDASQWNKGVYFVQINNSKNQFNKKIIVR
jgi:hypothetical protein